MEAQNKQVIWLITLVDSIAGVLNGVSIHFFDL